MLGYLYGKSFGSQSHTYLPIKMKQCSETSAYKIQTPRNYPEGSI